MVNKIRMMYELLQKRQCSMEDIEKELHMTYGTCKTNMGNLKKKYGDKLQVTIGAHNIRTYRILTNEEYEGNPTMSMIDDMADLLKEHPYSIQELCNALNTTKGTISTYIERLRHFYGAELKAINNIENLIKYSIVSTRKYESKGAQLGIYECNPPADIRSIKYISFPKNEMGKDEIIEWASSLSEKSKIVRRQLSGKDLFDIFIRQGGTLLNDREKPNVLAINRCIQLVQMTERSTNLGNYYMPEGIGWMA